MKTFIHITDYCGVDFHDCTTQVEYLKEDGSLEITNPDKVIFDFVKKAKEADVCYCKENNITIKQLASDNEIKNALRKKEDITVLLAEDYENELYLCYEDGNFVLTDISYYGNFTSEKTIKVQEIEEKNIRYIAAENFLHPRKCVPSIQRFYHEPFEDFEEFSSYFENMELHGDENVRSVKEMLIVDILDYIGNDWYMLNMECIKLLNSSSKFFVDVEEHLKALKEKMTAKDIAKAIRNNEYSSCEVSEIFRALQEQGCVLGGKIWTDDDIIVEAVERYNLNPDDLENGGLNKIINNLGADAFNDCTDSEWNAIYTAIENYIRKEGNSNE